MHRDEDLATIATFYRRVQWSALTVGVLWVVWLLAPILSPFVIAAILGWLGIRWWIGWKRDGSAAIPR